MESKKRLDTVNEGLIASQNRLKVIRQDRINVEEMACYIEFGQTAYKIINLSPFGILIQSNSQFSNECFQANLIVEDVDLGLLSVRQVRRELDAADRGLVGFEVIGEPISVDRVIAIRDSTRLIKEQESYQLVTRRIPDAFARKVYEIKDWLEELQTNINALDSAKNNVNWASYPEYENTIVQVIGNYLNQLMPAKNKVLSDLIRDFNSEVIKSCYEFFRVKLENLIYQSPFSKRVYSKPLGYAGDYEMMNIIYRDKPDGETLFAKCLHDYWIRQPAAQAVRNRADFIKGKIDELLTNDKDRQLKFLSVACGPAMEWQRIIAEEAHSGRQLEIGLLDQDEGALKHVQRRMRETSIRHPNKFGFDYIHQTIKTVIARGLESQYDFIYSAGLYDYFSDPVAQMATAKLFQALKPGGQLIIGNFNVENPNSIMMDLALDWHLIYRTKDDFIRMFEGIGGKIAIESEPLGINLFCTITKI